jgi:hypothetical protein
VEKSMKSAWFFYPGNSKDILIPAKKCSGIFAALEALKFDDVKK